MKGEEEAQQAYSFGEHSNRFSDIRCSMRFHENCIFQLLLYYSTILLEVVESNVIFTVEESNVTTPIRHLHRLRHSKGPSPYLTASSSVINQRESNRLESFSLNCPHVVDSSNKNVHIEVVWTLNETVWLKIEKGHQRVVNGESTFNKRRVSGKTVMRLLLNNARYLFDYDELTGDFSMEISPVLWSSDSGAWQCHVTVRQENGKSHTLTSRRRIKAGEIGVRKETRQEMRTKTKKEDIALLSRIEEKPEKMTEKEEEPRVEEKENVEFANVGKESSPILLQKRGDRSSDHLHHNVASFSRNSDDNVYMTRKSEEISTNVIFARTDGALRHHHKPIRHRELERLFDAQIDYELDMSTDDMYYQNLMNTRARARSAHYYYNEGNSKRAYLTFCSLFFATFYLFL